MKFFHLSDIRLGNITESGYSWDDERIGEITSSLKNVMKKAEEGGIKLIMVTGGMFAHVPVEDELFAAADILRAHPGMEVVITAGEADAITGYSPVLSFAWPKNVHYITGPGVQRVVLSGIGTEVYAASCVAGPGMPAAVKASDFAAEAGKNIESEPIRIAMFSTAEAKETAKAFAGCEFSYVAAGGSARYAEIIKGCAYASGRLEPADTYDTGTHGLMSGDIDEDTGKLNSIEFVPMASAMYITLNIRITGTVTRETLVKSVASEIEKRGAGNIYRLRLTGKRNPYEDLGLEDIMRKFRIGSVSDETEPDYDYEKLFREHSQDMIGFYISNMSSGRSMSDTEKTALLYGIDALISTAGGKV